MKKLVLLLLTAGLIPVASAAEIHRKVLALHKITEGDSATRNGTYALLEQPLEALGLVVEHRNVEAGLPSDADMARYRGVITFFHGPVMTDARGYLKWLGRQAKAGRKVVIFGELGALQDRASGVNLSHEEVNRALAPLGFRYDGFPTADRSRISVVSASPLMSFEEPYTADRVDGYERIVPLGAGSTSYLTLVRTDLPDGESHPVLATPAGGYASRDQLLYEYRQGTQMKQRWHLNPYAFLSEALKLSGEPRMDAASLNGRRLWMAHVDGDGLLTPSESGLLCGEVMFDRVFALKQLPISVSIISGDLAKDPRAVSIAKKIFALPNIEAASHSASHPKSWTDPYVRLSDEIDGSIRTLTEKTLPAGKTVRLFTWSALGNPTAEALERLSKLGVANVNGLNDVSGFTNRFDRLYPSRTHLAPMTRHVGGFAQVNHRASNDYELTGGWSDDRRGGYQNIIETFDRTAEGPEIPAHAYFHFYSADSLKSLRALVSVLDWARGNAVAPVFVSDYAAMVADFRRAALTVGDDGRVTVSNAGACRTVVFPDPSRHVDFFRSEGVTGYAARHGNLYVFLDGGKRHVIALGDSPTPAVHLASAAGWVDSLSARGAKVTMDVRAVGDTEISLRVPSNGPHQVTVTGADDAEGRRPYIMVADAADNLLTFSYRASGRDRVVIAPATTAGATARRAGLPLLALSLAAFPILMMVRARRRIAS